MVAAWIVPLRSARDLILTKDFSLPFGRAPNVPECLICKGLQIIICTKRTVAHGR